MKLVYSTFPSLEDAKKIGTRLLEERLCGCYNCWPIESGYWWKDEIVHDEEAACIFKTTEEKRESLMRRLGELHPYSEPAIFSLPVETVTSSYETWLKEVTDDAIDRDQ